ncbi:MAG: thiamine-phosphate kinase [Deltaproteobacteria bacterium]|nr:thiamine-phosphate kinase [Deltaproteobacteria bacterium]
MSDTLREVGEFGLIRRIDSLVKREGASAPGVEVGIGDDAACLKPREGFRILVTCDCIVEGRHYLPDKISALDLGRRAMALNISDIGAMGGHPLYALVSLGLKAETPVGYVEDMFRGFVTELNPFGASIVGGNLTKTGDGLFIDITLIGEVEHGKMLRRSTAREGDAILVTGFPGRSAAGLKLLLGSRDWEDLRDHPLVRAYTTPSHRAFEGKAVADSGYATAMIDTSDGFLGDLGHICEESRVGAELYQSRLPVCDELREAARRFGIEPYELVLQESDDYELIITCAPENVAKIKALLAEISNDPVTEVGRIVDSSRGIILILEDGSREPLVPGGWDHFTQ